MLVQLETSRISKKVLWRTYVLAFLLLIVTVSCSHFLADWIVRQQEQYASIINISGRQRMLSQRITGLIADAFLANDAAERNARIAMVDDSIALMQRSHNLLTDRGAVAVDRVMSVKVKEIYFAEAKYLDRKVNDYLNEARALRDIAATGTMAPSERIRAFAEKGFGSLLPSLNEAVDQYQGDAESKLTMLRNLNVGLWIFTMAVIILELMFIFRPMVRRLDRAQEELEDIAHTDPLTGCWNRRALMKSGEMLWSLARRRERVLSVVICDIDKFKNINDTYGHGVGDEAIRAFAEICLDGLREYDILGRFGGEEFVLVLPETESEKAHLVAERIRSIVQNATISAEGVSFQMTASFGVASILGSDRTLQSLIDRADTALYSAKNNGRNRVESWVETMKAA